MMHRMKLAVLMTLALLAACLPILSCGSGSSAQAPFALIVTPQSADIWTDAQSGDYLDAVLTATLSNGQAPTSVQWMSSNACIAPGGFVKNTATVTCSFTCGSGTETATLTATGQGFDGTSTITCTWK